MVTVGQNDKTPVGIVNKYLGQNNRKDTRSGIRLDGKKILLYLLGGGGDTTNTTETTLGEDVATAESAVSPSLTGEVNNTTALTQSNVLADALSKATDLRSFIQSSPTNFLSSLLDSGISGLSSKGFVNDTLRETFTLLKAGIDNYVPDNRRERRR